jgi:hypothetical protein
MLSSPTNQGPPITSWVCAESMAPGAGRNRSWLHAHQIRGSLLRRTTLFVPKQFVPTANGEEAIKKLFKNRHVHDLADVVLDILRRLAQTRDAESHQDISHCGQSVLRAVARRASSSNWDHGAPRRSNASGHLSRRRERR